MTVEAASPALIEKVRTVVTDAEGQYKIVEPRPGPYSVTFSLAGFSTVKREGLELTTGFTATVNPDLRVGSLEETITVTGASPVVDTQNVRTQNVLSREVLDTVPTGKFLNGFAAFQQSHQHSVFDVLHYGFACLQGRAHDVVRTADRKGRSQLPVSYTFRNRVPVQLTELAAPGFHESHVKLNLGLYGQDQWTIRRLTLNLGLRFDYFNAYNPAQRRPGGEFVKSIGFDCPLRG